MGDTGAVSEQTLDLARRVLDLMGQRETDELVAVSDPDVEWYSLFAMGAGGVYRGHDGTRNYMRDLDDAWGVSYADVTGMLAIDDVAMAVGRIVYRGKDSGLAGDTAVGWVLKFRDGKITYFRAFRDPAQVFGAAGADG